MRGRLTAYGGAAIFGVLGGLATTAVTSGGDANASSALTLLGIAAVIVGGGEFMGGVVSPLGAMAGAGLFGLLGSVLGLANLNVDYTQLVEGAVLLLVLAGRGLLASRSVLRGRRP